MNYVYLKNIINIYPSFCLYIQYVHKILKHIFFIVIFNDRKMLCRRKMFIKLFFSTFANLVSEI